MSSINSFLRKVNEECDKRVYIPKPRVIPALEKDADPTSPRVDVHDIDRMRVVVSNFTEIADNDNNNDMVSEIDEKFRKFPSCKLNANWKWETAAMMNSSDNDFRLGSEVKSIEYSYMDGKRDSSLLRSLEDTIESSLEDIEPQSNAPEKGSDDIGLAPSSVQMSARERQELQRRLNMANNKDKGLGVSQLRGYDLDKLQKKALRLKENSDDGKGGMILQDLISKNDRNSVVTSLRNEQKFMKFLHESCANEHRVARPELSISELKRFHRPRLALDNIRGMNLSVVGEGKAAKKRSKRTATTHIRSENGLLLKDFVLFEYVEEVPPLLQTTGMATSIINYVQQQSESNSNRAVENTELKRKARLADTSVLPDHVKRIFHHTGSRKSRTQSSKTEYGDIMELEQSDHSPFLGSIHEMQSTILTDLFRAPIFAHDPSNNVFLMMRMGFPDGNGKVSYRLRSIPKAFLVGQMEPRVVVPRPDKRISTTQEILFKLEMIRTLRANPRGLTLENIKSLCPLLCRKISDNEIKGMLRQIHAKCQHNSYTLEDIDCDEAIAQGDKPRVTPMDVCIQHSQDSAAFYMSQYLHMDLNKLKATISSMETFVRKCVNQYARLCVLHESTSRELSDMLLLQLNRHDRLLSVLKKCFNRLAFAPWNTTRTFHDCVLSSRVLAKKQMTLKHDGDPSGISEGFAFVELNVDTDSTNQTAQMDLRKLKKEESRALLLALGQKLEHIENLTQQDCWDRIREIQTKMAIAKGSTEGLPYARIDGLIGSQMKINMYKSECQRIWNRQCASLSCVEPSVCEIPATNKQDNTLSSRIQNAKVSVRQTCISKQMNCSENENVCKSNLVNLGSVQLPSHGKAIKKITRTLTEDNRVIIKISFSVHSGDIEEVLQRQNQKILKASQNLCSPAGRKRVRASSIHESDSSLPSQKSDLVLTLNKSKLDSQDDEFDHKNNTSNNIDDDEDEEYKPKKRRKLSKKTTATTTTKTRGTQKTTKKHKKTEEE